MSTPAESLRDELRAAQAGERVGEFRRNHGTRIGPNATVSPNGTRIPQGRAVRSLPEKTPTVTGQEIIPDSALAGLRLAVLNVAPTSGLVTGQQLIPDSALAGLRLVVLNVAPISRLGIPEYLARPAPVDDGYFDALSEVFETRWPVHETTTLDRSDSPASVFEQIRREILNSRPIVDITYRGSYARAVRFAEPTTAHPGLAAVAWLRDFLRVSRDRVLQISGVPPATFYSWQSRPESAVRPKTISRLLRVTASLKLLTAALGADAARLTLNVGSPTLLDQLAGCPAEVEAALKGIAEQAQPMVTRPVQPMTDPRSILARLRLLDGAAELDPDPNPLLPATRIDEREAERLQSDTNDSKE
jgi:hypothetical protein